MRTRISNFATQVGFEKIYHTVLFTLGSILELNLWLIIWYSYPKVLSIVE